MLAILESSGNALALCEVRPVRDLGRRRKTRRRVLSRFDIGQEAEDEGIVLCCVTLCCAQLPRDSLHCAQ